MKYTLEQLNKMVERANETGGSLFLRSLTSIPEGFNPTVGGDLFLRSLTSIPEGFNPTVGGSLFLNSLTSKNAFKVNRLKNGDYVEGKYLYADRILTHVNRTKKIGEYTYYIGKIPGRNVIFDGKNYAHCKNIRDGISDLQFKAAKDRGAEQYKGVGLDDLFTVPELMTMYRVITGACRAGTQAFVDGLKDPKERYTVREVMGMIDGRYGAETFRRFWERM